MEITKGKWNKHLLMSRSPDLNFFLPETKKMMKHTFWGMLEKYGVIMAKPDQGCMGKGVIQISDKDNDKFLIHEEGNKEEIQGREETYTFLKKAMGKRKYIVQYWIPLATVGRQPFDIRVLVQRRKNSRKWVVTGQYAKVAHSGYIITNVVTNVHPVEEVMESSSLQNISIPIAKLLRELEMLSLRTAKYIGKVNKRVRLIGLDMGIDHHGNLWIIEVNLRNPAIAPFRDMDRNVYRRILSYIKG